MKKWSREEIEEWCHRAETESFFSDTIGGSEIIRHLLHQLEECKTENVNLIRIIEDEKSMVPSLISENCELAAQLDEAEATIVSLRADIQAGVQDIFMKMYRATGVVCAYCGDRPVDPETHWEMCEKHPARKQLDEAENFATHLSRSNCHCQQNAPDVDNNSHVASCIVGKAQRYFGTEVTDKPLYRGIGGSDGK